MTLEALLQDGSLDEAQALALERLEADPLDVEASVCLARLALFEDDVAGAKELMAQVPVEARGYAGGLVDALLLVAGERLDEGVERLRELTRLEPERTEAYVGLAEAALANGDQELGLRALKKAAVLDDGNWWLHYRLGVALAQAELVEDSVTHLTRALELNPADERPVASLSAGLLEAGELDAAEELLRDFFEREGEPPQLVALLVQVLVRKGELDEARNLAVLLADANEEQPLLQTEAARLLLTDGDVSGAIARCERVLSKNDAPALTHVVRAQAAELSDPPEPEVALTHYEAALELEPDDAGVHTNLGLLLLQLERFDESHEHLSRALELEPDSHAARYNLGLLLARRGKATEARAMLAKAAGGPDALLDAEVKRLLGAVGS